MKGLDRMEEATPVAQARHTLPPDVLSAMDDAYWAAPMGVADTVAMQAAWNASPGPQLLTALKDAVDDLVMLSSSRWSELECSEDDIVGSYRAVIAKATEDRA